MKISDYAFTKKDYETLTYDVTAVDAGVNLLEHFPGLHAIPQLHMELSPGRLEINKLIRYIILSYDRKSPLRTIAIEHDRKMYALLNSGVDYNTDTGLFPKHWENVMRCQNKITNQMILAFVIHFNSPKYTQLIVGTEMFNEQMLLLMNPAKKEKDADADSTEDAIQKQKLWDMLSKRRIEIEKLAEEITSEKNPFLKEDLFSMVNNEIDKKFNISPEERVENRLKREQQKK